jgi:hypothetical protein
VRQKVGFVSHVTPAVQATHTPPLQTWSVPQVVPFGSGKAALSTQTDEPVAHEVRPVRQKVGFASQVTPAVQATHTPPLQTSGTVGSTSQVVPFAIAVAVSIQTCWPVAQEFVPATQELGFVEQVPPAVQATHVELKQTWFNPQVVPFAIGVAVSMQVSCPVEQSVVPATHGFGFVEQAVPAVQATHVPVKQTWFVPQTVPFASDVPVSVQTWKPVSQVIPPVWQLFVGVHASPTVHGLHTPSPHTAFVPQTVPFTTLPFSTQSGRPESQLIAAVLQMLAV